ncbi:MAG: ABC transporter permease [Gemmatimonadota bacterium]|nr:ABC transporter permease [Gemmatimonadota bacterium]
MLSFRGEQVERSGPVLKRRRTKSRGTPSAPARPLARLRRLAILACTAVVTLMLSAALLVRGGGGGPFHTVDAAVTPTVETEGFPAPDYGTGAAELADVDRLVRTTLALVLMAGVTALVSLLGVIAADNLALEGRRVVEVMLGAPPGRMMGGAAKWWGRCLLCSLAVGAAVAAGAAVVMTGLAPPGISFATPSWLSGLGGLLVLAGLLAAAAVLPVRSLYGPSRPLVQEAESQHLTDPRPRRFNRVLMITLQLSVAVTIVAASGLFLLSRGGDPWGVAGTSGPGAADAHPVLGVLTPTGSAAGDGAARAALYASALATVRRAPELVAESLATPGAWIGRGPEVRTANECGRCSNGGMPHPIHVAIVKHHAVMPGFFAERGLPFVAGRGFGTEGTRAEGTGEVVINQAYARAHFLEPPVIGRRVALGGLRGEWHVVVGVVRDGGGRGLGASGSPHSVYFSALDHPPARIELVASVPAVSAADEDDSVRIVRESLAGLPGSGLALTGLRPATEELERVYGTSVWLGGASRGAGLVAALVAVLGMVGTMRTHVRSRLRDMGIRSALGAAPRALKRLILREALRMGVAGVGMGLWGAMLVVGVLAPPGVDVFNAPLFLAIAVIFVGGSVAAAVPSARLAATAEPREVMDAWAVGKPPSASM